MPRRRRPRINVNIPGYTPDYAGLLQNDPSRMQYIGGQETARIAGRNKRNSGIISRLVGFGQLPDLTGIDLGDFGIDAATIAAIKANTAGGGSETARLQNENAGELQNLQDELAARGILRSGSLGLGLRKEQTRYGNAQATARQRLIAALQELQGDFAADEGERASDLIGFDEQIGERIRDANPAREARSTRATKVGPNLYQDADGNYYDRHGNSTLNPARRSNTNRRRLARRFPRPQTPRYGSGGQV